MAPGDGHSARDRSLSILIDAAAPGGLLVHDHAGDGSPAADLAAKDFVLGRLGLDRFVPGRRSPVAASRSRPSPQPLGADDAARTARARALWDEARPPAGTPVETYLARRSLTLSDGAEEVIRFHPHCPFAGERTPAMVALVRDVLTTRPAPSTALR